MLWVIPYALVLLLMVFAMMEFTISLLEKPPRQRQPPVDKDELRRRLLALNEASSCLTAWRTGRRATWSCSGMSSTSSWRQRFARVRLDVTYRARFLLDETHHELRSYEILHSSSFFMGFDGWIPRLSFSYWMQAGFVNAVWAGRAYGILPGFPPRIGEVRRFALNTAEARNEIRRIALDAGWGFRPVTWGFQVHPRSYRFFETLTPAPLRRVPRRWFYGVLYPLTFFGGIAYAHGDAGRVRLTSAMCCCSWGYRRCGGGFGPSSPGCCWGRPKFWRRRAHANTGGRK